MFGQTASTSATSQNGSGFEGTMMMSPARPGPIRKGAENSKPVPSVTFNVTKKGDSTPVTSFTTDAAGKFRVSAPPGTYIVIREGGKSIGHYGPFEVEVTAGEMKNVGEWRCDSGMR
jgi:hypothetical protein